MREGDRQTNRQTDRQTQTDRSQIDRDCERGKASTRGPFHKKILRLRYTLRTSSSSFLKSTTSAIVSQQTIVTTTFSHTQSLVMFKNTHNHMIIIFVKRIFAPDICLRLRSLLRFFVKRGPGINAHGNNLIQAHVIFDSIRLLHKGPFSASKAMMQH